MYQFSKNSNSIFQLNLAMLKIKLYTPKDCNKRDLKAFKYYKKETIISD